MDRLTLLVVQLVVGALLGIWMLRSLRSQDTRSRMAPRRRVLVGLGVATFTGALLIASLVGAEAIGEAAIILFGLAGVGIAHSRSRGRRR